MTTVSLCEKAIRSILSLWDKTAMQAFRNSQAQLRGDSEFRPTVTCNAIVAFESYGLFGKPFLDEPDVRLDSAVLLAKFGERNGENWAKAFLSKSAHKAPGSRQVIFLNHSMHAIAALLRTAKPNDELRSQIQAGMDFATTALVGAICPVDVDDTAAELADKFSLNPQLSSFLLLYANNAIRFRRDVYANLGVATGEREDEAIRRISDGLERYFERDLDRTMSRRELAGDAGFDAAALAFSLRGLSSLRGEAFRRSVFFSECVRVATSAQTKEGTWPDGVAAMIDEGSDTLQQPSAKIALVLAETVFEQRMLVAFHPAEMSALRDALPRLQRFAAFLASSLVADHAGRPRGWSSDRVRWPSTAETWITTLGARFLLRLHLAEVAVARAAKLADYNVSWPRSEVDPTERLTRWESLGESDQVCKPFAKIRDSIIRPIIAQQKLGHSMVVPDPNGVSLLLFGPPGSGKTFFVKQLRDALGWPLIAISPGDFVSHGAELIESRAAEIFASLGGLSHAIAFFDECDELFRDRDEQSAVGRTILSFITASMLPKLQDLHDRRAIVFVVATNYLHRIDRAIRRPGRFDLLALLDRPDADARKIMLSRLPVGPAACKIRVRQTAGLTTKEILDYGKSSGKSKPNPGTRDDYIDWSSKTGPSELGASGLSIEDRKAIQARWKSLKRWPEAPIESAKRSTKQSVGRHGDDQARKVDPAKKRTGR